MALMTKIALLWRRLASALDARALIALVSLGGAVAWFAPWPLLLLFLLPATLSAASAYALLPDGRGAFKAYLGFVVFWAASYIFLQLWEHWGEAGAAQAAMWGGLIFGGRLFAVLGLALLLPLCVSAVTIGRALAWYLSLPASPLRGRAREKTLAAAWKAGLGLCIMAAFLPRVFRALKGLLQSVKLRAPHLPLHRRLWLLGLSALRLLSTQTWDMSVSIAARGLYSPEPWAWRAPVKLNIRPQAAKDKPEV